VRKIFLITLFILAILLTFLIIKDKLLFWKKTVDINKSISNSNSKAILPNKNNNNIKTSAVLPSIIMITKAKSDNPSDKQNYFPIEKEKSFNKIEKTPPLILKQNIGANLEVCGIGENCSGDVGSTHWKKEATINITSMKRGFKWKTTNSDITTGLLEVSLSPFDNSWPSSAIYSQNVSIGEFVFDFSSLLKIQENNSDKKTTIKKNLFSIFKKSSIFHSVVLPETYYLRVVPIVNGELVGKPTNEVIVRTILPSKDIKVYTAPNIYTVKIKEFQPIKPPDPNVCSHAMILDTDYIFQGKLIAKAGQRFCPKTYKGEGEKSWYESFWDSLKSGFSWISKAYEKLKSFVVNIIGDVVCGSNEVCLKGLKAGFDIGLVALGLPPDLPNFDSLVDQGFDYLVSEIATEAGCSDEVCKDLIKKGLKTVLDQHKSQSISQACDTEAAHSMGIEPVCFPEGVIAHWDPAALHQDAKVVLTISRNDQDLPKDFNPDYTLTLTNWAYNSKVVGDVIVNIPPYQKKLIIEKPLEGKIFQDVTLPIPKLKKGETIDIPINLVATEYWVPGHRDLMGGWTTVTFRDGWPSYEYDDWWLFYKGAEINFSANITGFGGVQTTVSSDSQTVNIL